MGLVDYVPAVFVDRLQILAVLNVFPSASNARPSISAPRVKVLAKGSEQKISLPPGYGDEPPRLGNVGKAELYINQHREFGKRPSPPAENDEDIQIRKERVADAQALPVPKAVEALETLGMLRRAAWSVIGLLALILMALILIR